MKESEASTILKTEIVHHPEYSIFAEALGIAIQALEKQVPKKPDFTEDKEFALCPCCNGKGLLNKQKYCDNCGQNSIVVDVMCAMFKNLNIKQGDNNETLQTN